MQFFPFMSSDSALGAAFGSSSGVATSARSAAAGAGRTVSSARDHFANVLQGALDLGTEGTAGERQAVLGMWDKAQGGLSSFARSGGLREAGARLAAMDERVTKASRQGAAGGTFNLRALAARSGGGALSGIKELSELKMTREDLLALKDGLRTYGLTRADVDALDERIASQAGMSWGQFMAALSEKMVSMGREASAVQLTEVETRDLQSLFQKIGFTAGASDKLLSQLQAGKTATVWQAVSDKLATMPEGQTVELAASELATLGKVMKLSESGQARLAALFAGADSATVSARQLTTAMTVLKAEVASDKEVDATSNQALRELVGQALTAAAERAGLSRQADGKPDNSERNQKVLAEHSRRERAREAATGETGDGDEPRGHAERVLEADPNGAAHRAARSAQSKDAGESAGFKGQGQGAGDGAGAEGESKGDGSGRFLGRDLGNRAEARAEAMKAEGAKATETEAAWKEMWDKIRVERGAADRSAESRQAENRLAAAAVAAAPADKAAQAVSRLDGELTARALRQVESGILKTMGQGRSQLVLRLDPPDLGKLQMVLSVKDGEVSATFRAETHDAHKLISEQLAHLKTQLEQQGIKVGKMEVQTQLSGEQNGNQWLGAGNHNQAQEQENLARRGSLLRILRGDGDGDDALARELLNEPRTARIAREGLDIIA